MAMILKKPSLVQYAADVLLEGIERGEWRERLPGERALCVRLQISRPTLRDALKRLERDGHLVTEHGKRRKITRRAPRKAARHDRVVFLTDRALHQLEPFAVLEIDELRRQLHEVGYRFDVVRTKAFARRRTAAELEQVVREGPAAAWVLYRAPRPVQAWFSARAYPAVVMGTVHPGIALGAVDVDFRATARHAVGVLRKRGHDPARLALLVPEGALAGNEEARRGFLEGVRFGAGGDSNDERIVVHGVSVDAVCRQIDHLMRCRPPPTGLIVARPIYAITVLGHLSGRLGLSLPDDISLLALDDEPSLQYAVPEIARYTKNFARFAGKLSRAILKAINGAGGQKNGTELFMPDFYPGETLGKAPAPR